MVMAVPPRASERLLIVVPIALFLIFVLLYTTFNSVKQAALIYTGIPFAIVGGIIALALRGMPFSISAGVGFIALFGVAVLNGVVMISFINHLREEGKTILVATHDPRMLQYASNAIFLIDGKEVSEENYRKIIQQQS